jgi:DNA-binding LytR/AlgR family response regulator
MQNNKVELLFLDINMPELNGMEYVKTLLHKPMIIFATAYPQYALDSYDLDAVDYLVKPIRIERFAKAITKAINNKALIETALTQVSSVDSVTNEYFFIKADRKFFKIMFQDVLFIEGLKDYVIIHTSTQKLITAMNIKTIANQLPETLFARISKSHIINVHHITSIDTYSLNIQQHELPLGMQYKDEFFKTYVNDKHLKR